MHYEGTTASGARSGATGSTSQFAAREGGAGTGSGSSRSLGTGTGAGTGSGVGTGSGARSTGITTGSGTGGGVSEGFRGLNITGSSGVSTAEAFRFAGLSLVCCSLSPSLPWPVTKPYLLMSMWFLQYDVNHPVVGDTSIVCDVKYYTAVSLRSLLAVSNLHIHLFLHHFMLLLSVLNFMLFSG